MKKEYEGLSLSIIGEKINDSIPSTSKLFEADDIDAVVQLAVDQAEEGATYIDVNVGMRTPEFMSMLVKKVQEKVNLPLCIDTPDLETQKAGIAAYDPSKADGLPPLVNSISELRMGMLELLDIQPVKMVLMCTERKEQGERLSNDSAQEIYDTAIRLSRAIKEKAPSMTNDDFIIDPGMTPVGADTQNLLVATIEGVRMIHEDPELAGVHMSVGLSNLSVQLPPKTKSGDLVRTPLESAFLTITNPLGMDFAIANPKKKFRKLEDDHPALVAINDIRKLKSFDCLMRLQEFYSA